MKRGNKNIETNFDLFINVGLFGINERILNKPRNNIIGLKNCTRRFLFSV